MAKGTNDPPNLVCSSCGAVTTYDPASTPRFLRLQQRTGRSRRADVVVYRVRCDACGRERDTEAGRI
jgi:hypothetical protein